MNNIFPTPEQSANPENYITDFIRRDVSHCSAFEPVTPAAMALCEKNGWRPGPWVPLGDAPRISETIEAEGLLCKYWWTGMMPFTEGFHVLSKVNK